MGNHHSHGALQRGLSQGSAAGSVGGSRKDKSLSRSASGADIQESKYSTHLMPIDKLAKILMKHSQQEDNVQGISDGAFSRYVFPKYPLLAEKLFRHYHALSGVRTPYLGLTAFRLQCEKFLGMLDDDVILMTYVRMYSEAGGDGTEGEFVVPDSLRLLLLTAYRVAMDHYSEGPQMCLHIQRTLTAVIESCFHHKTRLSTAYVSRWLTTHCPRLLLPLHRYVVHCLATTYRALEGPGATGGAGCPFPTGGPQPGLLPMSLAWLLAGALGPVYSRPRSAPGPPGTGAAGCSAQAFLAKLVAAVPSHWVLLYSSDSHGRGANRFLHHVLSYRGPTVCLLRADGGGVFCVASPSEWHESHLYWGGDETTVLQMSPRFAVVERGPKMLFLNTTARGYPKGLRAGADPRKPVIVVDGGFEKIEYRNIPYSLTSIEVWGCGDQVQRETQLDIKKWQVKEAERQCNVKLSASEWLDHPDRYLLELAGRPQYNNNSQPPQGQ